MRLPKIFWNYFSFFSAAVISVVVATVAVNSIEKISRDQVKKELLSGGVDWADVETIGLQVFLIGNAPDEAGRFDALSLAGNVVDAERLIDQMNIIDNSNMLLVPISNDKLTLCVIFVGLRDECWSLELGFISPSNMMKNE